MLHFKASFQANQGQESSRGSEAFLRLVIHPREQYELRYLPRCAVTPLHQTHELKIFVSGLRAACNTSAYNRSEHILELDSPLICIQWCLCSLGHSQYDSIWFLSAEGKRVQVLSGHKDWISCCSVSSDCSMIASVGRFDRVSCGSNTFVCLSN